MLARSMLHSRRLLARRLAAPSLLCSRMQLPAPSAPHFLSTEAGKEPSADVGSKKAEEAAATPTLWQRFEEKYLSRAASTAEPGFNRWGVIPGTFLIQISVGSVYAWSLFNPVLTKELGVVAASSLDWGLAEVVPVFSTAAVSLGLTTFFLGSWAERKGPRMVAATGALCWGGGLALSALGCYLHQLPFLYVGYGLLGGAGWGLGYISPVSNLIKWFPDRKGMATGLALTAFGGGAVVASPLNQYLLERFRELPICLGRVGEHYPDHVHSLVTDESGRRMAELALHGSGAGGGGGGGGEMVEVVVASAADAAAMSGVIQDGVYVVGTGVGGAGPTFLALGAGYTCAMLLGAYMQRVPREGWLPPNYKQPDPVPAAEVASQGEGEGEEGARKGSWVLPAGENVSLHTAVTTPQFYLLWAAVCGNAIAGVSIISCAKTIMVDTFGNAMPLLVTAAFTGGYVSALSAGNSGGRLGWSMVSDYIGRKNTYFLFGSAIPIAATIPYLTDMVTLDPEHAHLPLLAFYGGTVVIVSFYGGIFSVLPAYLGDLFGTKNVGAIHGKVLPAWSTAALLGPRLLVELRQRSYDAAAHDLAAICDPARFREAFGAGAESLDQLLAAKTVTIARLMEIVPPGTPDPTPGLYDSTMLAMSGILTGALLCNAMVRPVDPRYYDSTLEARRRREQEEEEAAAEAARKEKRAAAEAARKKAQEVPDHGTIQL